MWGGCSGHVCLGRWQPPRTCSFQTPSLTRVPLSASEVAIFICAATFSSFLTNFASIPTPLFCSSSFSESLHIPHCPFTADASPAFSKHGSLRATPPSCLHQPSRAMRKPRAASRAASHWASGPRRRAALPSSVCHELPLSPSASVGPLGSFLRSCSLFIHLVNKYPQSTCHVPGMDTKQGKSCPHGACFLWGDPEGCPIAVCTKEKNWGDEMRQGAGKVGVGGGTSVKR